ncbi:hypothetical protein DVV95_06140 [Clostridium botulinum]|uniref:hypothetical protein n=1 Tax=Clostridium botulinum TaxID=1491 RepID=UPI001967F276|nr:hypothetical protein [Clostridium botulinum]MBN1061400.1 hypothetical protein [Clostridium botulinum]
MQEYIFSENEVDKGYNAIFLCGVKYNKGNSDKRNVLKKYLEDLDEKNKVIILEENFKFGKSTRRYLSYDDIFMKNLKDIETLTAIFSDKVFIIHESISTAAEFGMFATNKLLNGKLCLLTPNEYSVEETKITAFLRLAFFYEENNIRNIVFYPEVEQWKTSQFKSDFRTSFFNNKIGINLSNQITDFLNENKEEKISINFKKAVFGKYSNSKNDISYFDDRKNNKLKIKISTQIIKTHIISFFKLLDFRTEIRTNKNLTDHITYIERFYKRILLNTISEREGKLFDNIVVSCKDCNLEFRRIISYTLYLLQAMKLINLVQSEENTEERKISITMDFENLIMLYDSLIEDKINTIIEE